MRLFTGIVIFEYLNAVFVLVDYAYYAFTRSRIAPIYLTAQLYSTRGLIRDVHSLTMMMYQRLCRSTARNVPAQILCKMLFAIASFPALVQQYFQFYDRNF